MFVVGILAAWLVWGSGTLPAGLLVLPAGLFVGLVIRHDRVLKELELSRRRVSFYETGIARVEDRWEGTGTTGNRFGDPEHPYAVDLDLFGRGSVFELLCTARTRTGEETLAAWLLAPAEGSAIRARQEAVRELAPRLELREHIALLGSDVRSTTDPVALAAWGSEPARPFPVWQRIAAGIIGAVSLTAVFLWFAGYGPIPMLAMAAIGQMFLTPVRSRVSHIAILVAKPAKDLELLGLLLGRLERESFESPLLRDLLAGLNAGGRPASKSIGKLQTLVDYLKSRDNMLFAPFAELMLWRAQFAFAIEAWREVNGAHVAEWLTALGEIEALGSLANYAHEHPGDVYPELEEHAVCVQAESVAHPLLPAARAIPNDLRLGEPVQAYIVSGSNMSGKSTLLRTLGVNIVLALAGSPVRATRFRLSPVTLGASIRTQDSLQGGVSRFYAEITRLRLIMELAADHPPTLFLLDEILHGTNSHDRLIGAEAVVRGLLARGAIGLVTTHDLALARISEEPALRVANVHFQDDITNGKMTFDYQLRPGIVEKSNAIELMRSVGLPV